MQNLINTGISMLSKGQGGSSNQYGQQGGQYEPGGQQMYPGQGYGGQAGMYPGQQTGEGYYGQGQGQGSYGSRMPMQHMQPGGPLTGYPTVPGQGTMGMGMGGQGQGQGGSDLMGMGLGIASAMMGQTMRPGAPGTSSTERAALGVLQRGLTMLARNWKTGHHSGQPTGMQQTSMMGQMGMGQGSYGGGQGMGGYGQGYGGQY